MIFTNLHAATNTWNTVGKAKEKGLFDFDFIKWMAWTWPTASFFIFIAICITVMYFWEKKSPGGNPRKGVLTLNTTRGDRLFVSLLSDAFIHLAWLGLTDLNLLFATFISSLFAILVFRYV